MKLIHYGSCRYDPKKFKPVKNPENYGLSNKPKGGTGLWTSPVDSEWGWKQWCEAAEFGRLTTRFTIELSKYAKVLTIDTEQDWVSFISKFGDVIPNNLGAYIKHFINFEKVLTEGYDAIHGP